MLAENILNSARSLYNNGEYKQAIELFGKAADKGNTEAMFTLGIMYLSGRGTDKDIKNAKNYISKAKYYKHPVAMLYWDIIKDYTQEDIEADKAVNMEGFINA